MSEGYCDVDFGDAGDDAEPVEFYDAKIVRARKACVCTECGSAIAKGDEHWYASYRFEGKFQSDRRCAACHEAAREFDFHVLGGLLWENFREEWAQGAHITACLARLKTVEAKQHMQQQWAKWKGLKPGAAGVPREAPPR